MRETDLKKLTFDELFNRYEQVVSEFDLYRRTMEQRLMLQRELTERHAQTKSAIISKISHNIRIPMNGVLGMIDILKQSPLNQEQSDYLHIIQSYSTQLFGMINDLSDLTKIESGDVQIINSPCEINAELEEVINGFKLRAKGKGILFEYQADQITERITCDAHRIKQVVSNLLNNALQSTKTGGVNVNVKLNQAIKTNTTLEVEISDTGKGLSETDNALLMNAIKTSDYMSLLKIEAWGISLAISFQLIKLMNGNIKYEARRGQGNSFRFTIPVGIGQNTYNLPNQSYTMNSVRKMRPLKILLVEDNLLNQKFAVATLVREGHSVDIAENGKIAVSKYKSEFYDLILMDIQMPVMDGIQATLKIREMEKDMKKDHIMIVAVTAYALEKDRARCLSAGMDNFLAKPFKPQELVNLINNLDL